MSAELDCKSALCTVRLGSFSFFFSPLFSTPKYMFQPSSPRAAFGHRGCPLPVSGGYCRSTDHACLDVALVVKGGVINPVTPPPLPLAERGESVERADRASLNIDSRLPAAERKSFNLDIKIVRLCQGCGLFLQWTSPALSILQGENSDKRVLLFEARHTYTHVRTVDRGLTLYNYSNFTLTITLMTSTI